MFTSLRIFNSGCSRKLESNAGKLSLLCAIVTILWISLSYSLFNDLGGFLSPDQWNEGALIAGKVGFILLAISSIIDAGYFFHLCRRNTQNSQQSQTFVLPIGYALPRSPNSKAMNCSSHPKDISSHNASDTSSLTTASIPSSSSKDSITHPSPSSGDLSHPISATSSSSPTSDSGLVIKDSITHPSPSSDDLLHPILPTSSSSPTSDSGSVINVLASTHLRNSNGWPDVVNNLAGDDIGLEILKDGSLRLLYYNHTLHTKNSGERPGCSCTYITNYNLATAYSKGVRKITIAEENKQITFTEEYTDGKRKKMFKQGFGISAKLSEEPDL